MDQIRLPAGVGFTAIQVAAEREREAARPDALFADPLAAALVAQVKGDHGEGPVPYLGPDAQWLFGDFVALRTCFIDEQVMSAVPGLSQVVAIAAGLDGRGYRLAWPEGVRVYEIDRSEVLDFKQQVVRRAGLKPTVDLVPVAADLRHDWPLPLQAAGFAAEQPTLWIVEGILNYLEREAADHLITQIGNLSAPSSRLVSVYNVGDLAAVALRAGRAGGEEIATIKKLWKSGPSIEPVSWLSGHGWQAEAATVADWAVRLGRPVPPAMDPELDGGPYYFASALRP